MWIMLTVRNVHHALSTLPVGIKNTWKLSKQISKLFFQGNIQWILLSIHEHSLLGQIGGGRKLWETKKVSPFMKFERIQPLLCYLLDPLTKKYSRVWSSLRNFMDKFQYMSEKSSCQQEEGLIINYSFKEKMSRRIWCCLVDHVINRRFLLLYVSIKFLD